MKTGIRNWLHMLLLTLLLGLFAGLVIWIFLKLVALCTGLIWETAPAHTGGRWIIVPVCVLGALAAGILRKKYGDYPESLDTVMGKIKKDHHYSCRPMLVLLLCAFLPLVLGASVGPEAGLAGIIAALCYWVGDNVTYAKQNMDLYSRVGEAVTLGQLFHSPLFGILAVEEGEEQLGPERMPRGWRLVLYALSTASGFAVIWLLNSLFGKAMAGFPSFSEVPVSTADGFLALVYIPVGFLLFLFYEGCEAVMGKAAKMMPPVLKETLCGLIIGLVGLVCPMVLFSGEEQMGQLITNSGGYGVLFLAGICLLKLAMTSFCLKFGMKGGHFFPLIFACTCMGYALGGLFFAGEAGHAAFAAGIITAAALGAQMKKPLAVTVLLLLCFPPQFLLWGFLSAAAGSGLAGIIEKRRTADRNQRPFLQREGSLRKMENLLLLSAITLGIIVLIGFLNEKFFHLNYEISLMLFSVLIGICLTVSVSVIREESVKELLQKVQVFDLEAFLMKGVLCFMLFAGSCHLTISQFRQNARPIGVLAFVCTLLGAVFYGLLFYAVASVFHLPFTLPVCLMFGSIIAPTDPIAATSILKKFGLPRQTGFLMEGESLLNDGVGVALFAVFSGIVTAQKSGGFLEIMLREILGAVLVGAAVTWLSFQVFKRTGDKHRRIIITLFAVSASFTICELLHCSGAIACVVCGVVFSTLREKEEQKGRSWELEELDTFWETLDVLLNSALYVILGLSFVRILQMPHVLGLALAAILCNLAARAASLWAGSWLLGPIPDGYQRSGFVTLFTWGGLRGGLSLALAVSTASIVPEETYVIILGCTYAIVFFTTVVQGLTMKKVFQRISGKTT